jgi:hypothetical protein
MKFLFFFLFLLVIFDLLDPDPDSGSTDLIESGSDTLSFTTVSQYSGGKVLHGNCTHILLQLTRVCLELYLSSRVPILESAPSPLEFYRAYVSYNRYNWSLQQRTSKDFKTIGAYT